MTEESFNRACETKDSLSCLDKFIIDEFENGTIKVQMKDINGIYLNKEISIKFLNFINSTKNELKQKMEDL